MKLKFKKNIYFKTSIALAIFGFMSSAQGMMRSPCGYPPYSGEESGEIGLPYSPSAELKKNLHSQIHSDDINQVSPKTPMSRTDDQENAEDQFRAGKEYYKDLGFPKAFEYFKKAAHQGHKEAQYNLGFMYYNGQGVNQNFPKSFECFKKAADQEHKEAQFRIGFMYYNGQGVIEQDFSKAFKYFKKAADQGHGQAQCILGDKKPIVFKETKESLPLGPIEKSMKKKEYQASGALGLALAQGNKKALEYSCLNLHYYKERRAMPTNVGERGVTMEECEVRRLYFEKANNERNEIIETETREIIDLMVSGEGEALPEKKTKNQTKDKKITKTLLRSRSMVNLSNPIQDSIGEDNSTQEIKQNKPRKKLQRTFSLKELPTAEGSVQMADMLAEEKPSDKKNKRPLTLSPFRTIEPTINKKSNREVDKKDKKNNDKKNKKRIKFKDIKKLRNKKEEKNLICASEESSLSESENESEHGVILQSPLIMKPKEKSILDKIFDINKPEITEKEFAKFCKSDAMKGIIDPSKTKKGFLLIFNHEEEWDSASAHREHGTNKTGLDPAFIQNVRKTLNSMGITPEKVTIKA